MTTTDGAPARLRELIAAEGATPLPGSYDALSARLAEQAGFDAVFTSGFSLSASLHATPDVGLLTMSENVDRVRDIVDAVSVPLVADADTGYGNALNVRRTVGELLDAGAAGLILEDQQWPKRCGHMDDKRVVAAADHARRIRAAADVREERDEDIVIIGRTDAREPLGLAAAIERGRTYEAAGADVVFVEAPQSRAELEQIAQAFDAPTFANMIEGGKTPYLSADELGAIGFDLVVYPLSPLFAVTRAMQTTYERLREDGHAGAADAVSFDEFETVIDAATYREREREYAALYADTDTDDTDDPTGDVTDPD